MTPRFDAADLACLEIREDLTILEGVLIKEVHCWRDKYLELLEEYKSQTHELELELFDLEDEIADLKARR